MRHAALPNRTGLEKPRVSSIFRILITYSVFARVKAGIRNRSQGFVVTDLSFPAYLYEGYTANPDDLEEGLFKGKILVQVCCAIHLAQC